MNIKIAIHRLAKKLTMVQVLYYSLCDTKPLPTEYIVFYINNDSRDDCDTGNEYRTIKVQFNVFSKALDNADTCDSILSELKTVIKKENLRIDDGSEVIFIKEDFTIPSKMIEGIYQSTVQYSIHIKNP